MCVAEILLAMFGLCRTDVLQARTSPWNECAASGQCVCSCPEQSVIVADLQLPGFGRPGALCSCVSLVEGSHSVQRIVELGMKARASEAGRVCWFSYTCL